MANPALLQAKLTGLLREAGVSASAGSAAPCPGGTAVADDSMTYVLLNEPQLGALGPVLLWARRSGHTNLTLLTDADPGGVSRRADAFSGQGLKVVVWAVEGTSVSPASPSPVAQAPKLSVGVMVFEPVIRASGALPVDDHGRLTAEVVGLEVARVSDDPDGEPRLEVGVGQADRELHDYVHGALSDSEALERAVAAVRPLRTAEAGGHPLSRIGRQRWLRSLVIEDPALAGTERLHSLPPLVPKGTLLGSEPAAALSEDGSLIVVCSVGIDPMLVPEGVDYRAREAARTGRADAELLFVVPERDLHQITQDLASQIPNASGIAVPAPWE